jgi:hypothetical protein
MKFPAGRATPGFWEKIESMERKLQTVVKPRAMKQGKAPKVVREKK